MNGMMGEAVTESAQPTAQTPKFIYDEARDIIEVVYPAHATANSVAAALDYMQGEGPLSRHGRALVNFTHVKELTLSSDDMVRLANSRVRDFGDRSTTQQFNAILGITPVVKQTLDAWVRFFPTGGGPVEMRYFESREDAVYWLMRQSCQTGG